MVIRYWPNPVHKRETSEAGVAGWRPNKECCPRLTVEERDDLLARATQVAPGRPDSSRYSMRRGAAGLEFYIGRFTCREGEDIIVHGYPTRRVPAKILRHMRDQGDLTDAEYKRLVRDLG